MSDHQPTAAERALAIAIRERKKRAEHLQPGYSDPFADEIRRLGMGGYRRHIEVDPAWDEANRDAPLAVRAGLFEPPPGRVIWEAGRRLPDGPADPVPGRPDDERAIVPTANRGREGK